METYYVPPVKKMDSRSNKSEISKGKLADKWRNSLTFLRRAEKLEDNTCETNSSEATTEGKLIFVFKIRERLRYYCLFIQQHEVKPKSAKPGCFITVNH